MFRFSFLRPLPFFSLFLFVGMVTSCDGQPSQGVARDISPTELKGLVEDRNDLLLIDVRTAQEWKSGHIAGASLIDFLEDDFSAVAHALPKNRPIALYCAAGGRSEDAMNNLAKAGFKELYNLRGGFYGWEDDGEAVAHGEPAPLPKND